MVRAAEHPNSPFFLIELYYLLKFKLNNTLKVQILVILTF